ncbi:MAG TPA: ABC transporter ATP-binding protein, partial [Acetobacteraceae bacterium]
SFRVPAGKTVALVGESGSGKTVISQSVMGLLPKSGRVLGGRILFNDPAKPGTTIDIAALDRDGPAIRALRGGRIGMIFQEPMSSLSPVHSIGNQIKEALLLHRTVAQGEAHGMVEHMLELVGFKNPHRAYRMYSFELSGGLRQRAMLAMALICRPALLIADEPTTALDVTIQAQILDLMLELQDRIGMAIQFISHNLAVVSEIAHEIIVMYAGRVVERAPADELFANPRHPYTQGLIATLPDPEKRVPRLPVIAGGVPNMDRGFVGCRFADRCPFVLPACREAEPPLLPMGPGHEAACIRAQP